MQPFNRLSGLAAYLPEDDVDTDIIFPARFLLITAREGLGRYAFHDRRLGKDGTEDANFVLNRTAWRIAPILIAGANFGSGSSREQAVWALLDRGVRCVIAPSFGEIFHANCFRNGILPIILPAAVVTALGARADEQHVFDIDLETQQVRVGDEPPLSFAVGAKQKRALINGWDETAMILNERGADITAFEERHHQAQPWLFEEEETR